MKHYPEENLRHTNSSLKLGSQQRWLYLQYGNDFQDKLIWMQYIYIYLQNATPFRGWGWGSWVCTCSFCLEHFGGETWVAETHSVKGQNSKGVMDIGWQLEVSRRLGSGDFGEILPVAAVVQWVLILYQKLCQIGKKTLIAQNWTLSDYIFAWIQ